MNPADDTTTLSTHDELRDLSTDNVDAAASKDPEQIRREIDRTRSELGSDVDALADKVTPSKIVQRQGGKIRTAVGGFTDRVMGRASEQGESLSQTASQAGDAVAQAKRTAAEKAQGNPLAVGLIAFGVGWLVASLIPASDSEQRMAASVKQSAAPLMHEAAGVAKDLGESLKEPAQDAANAVKNTAQDAADHVAQDAAEAQGTVKDAARRAAGDVEI